MKDVINEMHDYDKKRDASSKIRGFIFQDLLAIEKLISGQHEYLLSEWIEDVCYIDKKNIHIIQVKYYPKTSPKYDEIYKELYYDYLLCELENIQASLYLAIHKKTPVTKQKYQDVKNAIEGKKIIETTEQSKIVKEEIWAKGEAEGASVKIEAVQEATRTTEEVAGTIEDTVEVKIEKKEIDKINIKDQLKKIEDKWERIKYVIEILGSENKIKKFYCAYQVEYKEEITKYREQVSDVLYEYFKDKIGEIDLDEEEIKDILLGTALLYIQEGYDNDRGFSTRARNKKELEEKTLKLFVVDNSVIISQMWMYVYASVNEIYSELEEDASIEEDILKRYKQLFESTLIYLKKLFDNDEGRHKFLLTITNSRTINFNDVDLKKEIKLLIENKNNFKCYILNCWKILMNIKCYNFGQYIDENIQEYIAFNLPNEVENIIIMGYQIPGSESRSVSNVFRKIHECKKRPSKWYYRGKHRGLKSYTWDATDIVSGDEEQAIDKISTEERFYIECLECIKTDEQMGDLEECNKCIFGKRCKIDGGEKGLW
ncbi:hypothetical protein PBV87_13195 [Niameybacter massiliensis]|uniref:Uncharacterized protein n=1 Tax=Holtiella tumoricola TaxID=3018743 RepID=A0AA42DNT2_9FIRM|nr:hypothetical protein [Holtiella tumoricola]MDA3732443.1 hypothetical protein [Holtiella tumoricola]